MIYPEIRSRAPESRCQALMCKAFHGRSGLHPKMLPQGLKCLARQMMAANGGVILRISDLSMSARQELWLRLRS